MAINKGEFVAIEFEGKVSVTGEVFDKTDKPKTICIGAGWLLEGIDSALLEKNIGDSFELDLPPEKAFGQRNPAMMKLTSIAKFKEFRPVPGIQVTVDGVMATVKSVSGGRVVLDFNHPLAGKALHYKIKVVKQITDLKEKIQSVTDVLLPDTSVSIAEKIITIKTKVKLPDALHNNMKREIEKFVPEVKEFEFKFDVLEKKKDEKTEEKK